MRWDSPGPVFYRQERVGRGGQPFQIWKLRTMVPDAERRGPGFTTDGDSRVTRVGRWLRRYKLDELPQLFNVLTGSMSLVGPRPELPQYVSLYSPAQREVLRFRPGITDPTSIEYRDEEVLLAEASDPEDFYRSTMIPAKVNLNLAYAARATLFTDFGVILRTFVAIGRTAD